MEEKQWKFCGVCCQAKSWLLVLLLCLAAFVQGFVVNGLVNITISPLQKRFQLSSQDMGFVASSYDIANIVCVIPVSYLSAKKHKPLVIGLTFTILGLGSIIYSLPHFIAPSYSEMLEMEAQDSLNDTCFVEDCSSSGELIDTHNNRFYYGFFVAGQALNGVGAAALWTIGTVYIDENLSQKGAPMAIGYFEGTGVLGPAVGFLGGGALLNMWVDGSDKIPAGIDKDSELWIGNWWLGYLIGGILGVVAGCLIAALPKELEDASEKQEKRRQEHQAGQMEKTTAKTGGIKDAHKSTWVLFRNMPFMFIILAGGFEGGFVANASTYGTKYVEEVYGVSTATAAMAAGAVVVLAGALGQTLGGVWVGKTNPTVKKQLVFATSMLCISLLSSFVIFYHCDETLFVGANLSYDKAMSRDPATNYTDDDIDLTSYNQDNFQHSCFDVDPNDSAACECDLNKFHPLCINGLSYYSPCYAGCDSSNISAITQCSCLSNSTLQTGVPPTITSGSCGKDKPCYYEVFLGLYFLTLFFTFVNGVPATNSILRIVPPDLRSHAMALNIVMLRLLGTIPGPIIGGMLVDKTCSLWQTSCGERGSCRLYDRHYFMVTWMVLHVVYKVLGLTCWLGAVLTYKPQPESTDTAIESVGKNHPHREEHTNPSFSN